MDFFAPETAPFAVALCVTAGIAVIEAIGLITGLSASHAIDGALPDMDVGHVHIDSAHVEGGHIEPLGHVLSWFSFGRVPSLVILILLFSSFGLAGFIEQEFLRRTFGIALHPLTASIPAAVAAAFAARYGGRVIARLIPRDETDAVSRSSFLGQIATIVRGEARLGHPAEAKLRDIHGRTHYFLVEPDEGEPAFGAGSEVLIVRQSGSVFRAVTRLKPIEG
jgi:hypothetical protein